MIWVSEPTGQLSMFVKLLAHARAFVSAEITRLNKMHYKFKVCVQGVRGKDGNKSHLSRYPFTDKRLFLVLTFYALQFTYHSRLPKMQLIK